MNILFYAYYIADRETPKRNIDFAAIKIKQWVKGDPINGSFTIPLAAGGNKTFQSHQRASFFDGLWGSFARQIAQHIKGRHLIIPIPSHTVTETDADPYRTLQYAEAIAANSAGQLEAVDALRWRQVREAQRGTSGWRTPDHRYENLRVIADVSRAPIVIFDDVCTSGSSFAAAKWRLEEAGGSPALAGCVVKPCHEQLERVTGWHVEALPEFDKPMF